MSRAREFEHGGAEPQVLSSDFQRAIRRDQVDVYIHVTFERAILLALRNSSFAGRERYQKSLVDEARGVRESVYYRSMPTSRGR